MKGESKYMSGGVLAANGKIYFAPFGAPQVRCIDPEAQTAETFGPKLDGPIKYSAVGVLAANGKIFFAPDRAAQVLCIDPEG